MCLQNLEAGVAWTAGQVPPPRRPSMHCFVSHRQGFQFYSRAPWEAFEGFL